MMLGLGFGEWLGVRCADESHHRLHHHLHVLQGGCLAIPQATKELVSPRLRRSPGLLVVMQFSAGL